MAHGLSLRRTAAAALVIAVVVVHGWVANRVAELIAEFSAPQPMPPRIEVAFVREMQPSAPPPAVAPAPPPPRPRRERPIAAPAAPAASAAPPEPAPPEPVHEPAPELPAPVIAAAAASAPEPAASAPAFEWPASTRVSYVLTGNYRGEIHGSAQVEWVRVGLHYQMHLDVIVGLPFMPLLSRRMTSDGELTPAGLFPLRYDEESKIGFGERRRVTMVFEPDAVVLANGQRRERWPGVQDTASQFVQLTYLFTNQPQLLTPGTVIEMPLALPRRVDRWVYDVLGAETLDTPIGAVEGVHLKPRPLARRGGDLSAEIWFAPSLHYLPARIRIQQDDETYIDLLIKRRPQLAAQ
ncbi:MAG TPA: DUF3108 domain-containing protein [Albitalea sp.]|nr:DUF3108 domain-containing protein [Albitalea sp.]